MKPETVGLLMQTAFMDGRALVLTNTESGVVGYTVGRHWWWGQHLESRQEIGGGISRDRD